MKRTSSPTALAMRGTGPGTSNGARDRLNHRPDGKFTVGNTASRKHGLRAASRRELRRTNRRASRLMSRLVVAFADAGRPLEPLSLPTARKWAELEVMRVDLFAATQADPGNDKHYERYVGTCRLQLVVERALGMTPALSQRMRGDDGHVDVVKALALEAAR